MFDDLIDRDALLRIFTAEAEEGLAQMEHALVSLETSGQDPETINTIFRCAHTLKGNAATVGFEHLVELAHSMEDLLDALRAERFPVTPGLITLLLRCVDEVQPMLADQQGAKRADPKLLEALRAAVASGDHVSAKETRAAASSSTRSDTLRVGVRKLDVMLNLAGEIAIARGRLRALFEKLNEPPRELMETQELLDRLCTDLQEQVLSVRMVPVEPLFQQQVRVARDLATTTGKLVQLRLEGGDVELDTSIVEQIRDPLTHMVRNAIDHGIELSDLRVGKGKPASGTITLRAHHEAGMVVIEVADDGAGLDAKRIVERARQVGLIDENAQLTREEIYALVFAPGFSTADAITAVSGRGVGMDVVHRNMSALRGTVSIDSVPGAGTTVTMRLPLTVAIIDALSVGVGGRTFVIPLDDVVECLDITEADLESRTSGILDIRGSAIPFVRLAACLQVRSEESSRRNLLVVRNGPRNVAIVVDRLHTRTQAVIKPLWKGLPRLDGIAGATILGDGSVALILDLPRLLRQQLREAA